MGAVTSPLLRSSLKIALAGMITAALSTWTDRIDYVWYPLLAVVMVSYEDDDQTVQAAADRCLGTVAGGGVTFLVHTMLGGWVGVLVSMLVLIPVLRWLRWERSLSTACLVSVMFLMIPSHAAFDWGYALNRSLDTAAGCLIAIAVGLLFWPRNPGLRLLEREAGLKSNLSRQLGNYHRWVLGLQKRPEPVSPALLTAWQVAMEELVGHTTRMSSGRTSPGQDHRDRWPQRSLLWENLLHHWIQWERLIGHLPDNAGRRQPLLDDVLRQASLLDSPTTGWSPAVPERSAPGIGEPAVAPALLLALEEEQRCLIASFRSLHRLWSGTP
jgi:uncharacterized membrane protein YccC